MKFEKATLSKNLWGFGVILLLMTICFLAISFFPVDTVTYNGETFHKGDKGFTEVKTKFRRIFRGGSAIWAVLSVSLFWLSRRKKREEKSLEDTSTSTQDKATEPEGSGAVTNSAFKSGPKLKPDAQTRQKINRFLQQKHTPRKPLRAKKLV